MRAAVCRSYGPPEAFRVEDIPSPPIAAGQVRVRVDAAALNFPDVLLVADDYQVNVATPFVPGSEFAGVVEEVSGEASDASVTAVASSPEKLEVASSHGAANLIDIGRSTCARRCGRSSLRVPMWSSTLSVAISPNQRCGRCVGAAAW